MIKTKVSTVPGHSEKEAPAEIVSEDGFRTAVQRQTRTTPETGETQEAESGKNWNLSTVVSHLETSTSDRSDGEVEFGVKQVVMNESPAEKPHPQEFRGFLKGDTSKSAKELIEESRSQDEEKTDRLQ